MPQVEVTLEQLQRFVNDLTGAHKPVLARAMYDVADVLEETLEKEVFTNHGDTVEISTKQDLANYIRAGGNTHNPPKTPKKGRTYNKDYLARKARLGENRPHKYMEYGFYHGMNTTVTGYDKVQLSAKPPETSEKGIEYMVLHERRRSVLKLAFLRGWNKIIKAIINRFKEEVSI